MSSQENQAPAPCECTVSVMEEIPAADVTKYLKASKATLLIRGFIFLIFGLFLMPHPMLAIQTAVIILGVYVLFEGFAVLRSAFILPRPVRPLWITNGVLLLLLGIFSLTSPLFMGKWLIVTFGIWQLLTGLQCLLLPAKHGRAGAILSGLLSILAGLCFIGMPILGLAMFGWLFAVLFFFSGVLMLLAGFLLR